MRAAMGVNHGSLHLVVPEEFLDGPDLMALLEELSRESVPEGLAAHAFVELHRTPTWRTTFCEALARR